MAFVNALPKLRESRGLSDRLANALREMPAAIADDPRSDHLPVPFQPAEKGTYTAPLVAAGSGTLSVRVRFGSDYEAGQSDDLIDPSPFRPDAYLVDPKLDTSGPTEQLSYGATGPLVELLGFGASPPNPLPVDDPTLETELGKQILDCQTSVDDSAPEARIVRFAVRVRRRVLADLPLGDGTSQGTLEDDMHGDQGMFGEQGACFAGTTFAASASVRRGTR